MAKDLIVCLDGTANSPTRFDTSVLRLYRLAKTAHSTHKLYYDPGVGTLPRPGHLSLIRAKLGRVFGLASGHGIVENVAEAYEFCCNQYQPGDRIWLFGFSRGAYTARLVASVIHQIGLLPRDSGHLTPYAINLAIAGPESAASEFGRKLDLERPGIEFLGMFDCVRSAIFAVDAGWSPIRIRIPFSWYNPGVRHVRHAMAIDEFRAMFPVNRWAEEHTAANEIAEGSTVGQVWFPGNHCDVGGSNTSHGLDLAAAPLHWMMLEAQRLGLALGNLHSRHLELAQDHEQLAQLPCHDLSRGKWLIAEILPTYSPNDDDDPRHVFPHARRHRHIPIEKCRSKVHQSVLSRFSVGKNAAGGAYAPRSLAHDHDRFDWVT